MLQVHKVIGRCSSSHLSVVREFLLGLPTNSPPVQAGMDMTTTCFNSNRNLKRSREPQRRHGRARANHRLHHQSCLHWQLSGRCLLAETRRSHLGSDGPAHIEPTPPPANHHAMISYLVTVWTGRRGADARSEQCGSNISVVAPSPGLVAPSPRVVAHYCRTDALSFLGDVSTSTRVSRHVRGRVQSVGNSFGQQKLV